MLRTWYHKHRLATHILIFVISGVVLLIPFTLRAQEPGLLSGLSALLNVETRILEFLHGFVVGVFGTLMNLGISALNLTLEKFVFQFGELFRDTGVGGAVNLLWGVIRDLFNLVFIFGLVYIGFQLILRNDSRAKKTLATLIIAALLVNFSLFITKFIIDFTNIAAVQFVGLMDIKLVDNQNTAGAGVGNGAVTDIGGTFMGITGLSNIYGIGQAAISDTQMETSGKLAMIFGSMILMIIVFIVTIAGAFLMLLRWIALHLYMIFSPIMFLGFVFPNMARYSSNYWRSFLGRAFVAPAYVFMLYVSFLIINSLNNFMINNNGGAYDDIFSGAGAANAMSVLPFFILSCGFMIASVIVAQKMGADGANASIRVMNRVRYGAQGVIGRNTVGRAANVGEKANNNLQSSRSGRNVKRAVSLASLGTFTERSRQQAIASGKKAKFGSTYSWQDDQDFTNKEQVRTNQLEAERAQTKALADAEKAMEDTTKSADEVAEAFNELGKTMGKMTTDKKILLGFKKLTEPQIAANISDRDIEAFEKSGKFSNNQIAGIKDARKQALSDVAVAGSPIAEDATSPSGTKTRVAKNTKIQSDLAAKSKMRGNMISKLSTQDAGKLPNEVFTSSPAMYQYLTPAIVEARLRNGGVNEDEKNEMRKALYIHLGLTPGAPLSSSTNPKAKMWVNWQSKDSPYATQFFS